MRWTIRVARMKTQWEPHVIFSRKFKIIWNIKWKGWLVDIDWYIDILMHIGSAREILSWVRKKQCVMLHTVSPLIKIIYLEVNYENELIP